MIEKLLTIMARLRDPEHGCPWDRAQDFTSIVPYSIEETYEVAEAIRTGDMNALCEELGDLLLQIIFYCQMAQEQTIFSFQDVTERLATKLISRHPHVFGDEQARAAEDVSIIWERQKAQEKQDTQGAGSVLDDVPLAMPALMRAQKLQKKAAKIGFDWPDCASVFEKVTEEVQEVNTALATMTEAPSPSARAALEDEIGDLLFVTVNLARKAGMDAEEALTKANHKFTRRFAFVERGYHDNPDDRSLDQLERYWQQAKHAEKISQIIR